MSGGHGPCPTGMVHVRRAWSMSDGHGPCPAGMVHVRGRTWPMSGGHGPCPADMAHVRHKTKNRPLRYRIQQVLPVYFWPLLLVKESGDRQKPVVPLVPPGFVPGSPRDEHTHDPPRRRGACTRLAHMNKNNALAQPNPCVWAVLAVLGGSTAAQASGCGSRIEITTSSASFPLQWLPERPLLRHLPWLHCSLRPLLSEIPAARSAEGLPCALARFRDHSRCPGFVALPLSQPRLLKNLFHSAVGTCGECGLAP